jgi:non-ribosomal peptide synthase protein (TIGR01720 family)
LPWKTYRTLPLDYKESNTDTYNVSASSRLIPCEFDERRTTVFANIVSQQLGIQPADFLLLVVARHLMSWAELEMIGCQLVDTQRNFMEQQLGIDFSRTVGAFAFNRHVFISREQATDPLVEICRMHDQLQQIPLGGAGLQILKYAANDNAVRERARAIPASEFAINYFGSIDMGKNTRDEQVSMRPRPSAFMQHIETVSNNPLTLRGRVFGMSAVIKESKLCVWWEYSGNMHKESTVSELAEKFRAEMEWVLDRVSAMASDVEEAAEVAV